MDRHLPIRNLMTRDPVKVQITDQPSRVRHILGNHPFHHLPVCRGNVLVGIISDADLWPHTFDGYVRDGATVDAWLDESVRLENIMTLDPETVGPDDSLLCAAEKLAEGQFHALPVVEPDGSLVGIVTSTDVIRYMVGMG